MEGSSVLPASPPEQRGNRGFRLCSRNVAVFEPSADCSVGTHCRPLGRNVGGLPPEIEGRQLGNTIAVLKSSLFPSTLQSYFSLPCIRAKMLFGFCVCFFFFHITQAQSDILARTLKLFIFTWSYTPWDSSNASWRKAPKMPVIFPSFILLSGDSLPFQTASFCLMPIIQI